MRTLMHYRSLITYTVLLVLFLIISYKMHAQEEKYHLKKVVIDAGHGGKDPGALGKHKQEKDIALDIALKAGRYISKHFNDVEVIYTRTTDKFVELHERAAIANRKQADLFISIHVNALNKSSISGTSTYVMGTHKTDDNLKVAKRENSVILYEDNYMKNYNGYDPNSPEKHILFSLALDTYQEQSLGFASEIQKQFRERAMRKDLGVRQAGLVVLWQTTMPSVLVETGFITNKNEERYLSSDYGQSIIASAIFRAFRSYKQKIDKKSQFGGQSKMQPEVSVPAKEQSHKDITFYVQVMSLPDKKPADASIFKGLDVRAIQVGQNYKYVTGATSDPKEALAIQQKVRKSFPGAFVVAFREGEKISYTQAIKAINQ